MSQRVRSLPLTPRVLVVSGGSPSRQTPEWSTLIDAAPDPRRLLEYFDEFQRKHPEVFATLSRDPERFRWLALVVTSSRFLAEELLRHPHWLGEVDEVQSALTTADYKFRLESVLRAAPNGRTTAYELALFRRRELLRILLRDRLEICSLAEVAEELSNLADAILGRALAEVTADLASRHGTPFESSDDGSARAQARFTVFSLGKLGGRELNYSSDVDLMFLYSRNGTTDGSQPITNGEFFKKVANQFTNLLSTYTAAGQCYRVDLRLRPEGTHGEVCLSLAGAHAYYARRARDWELQMLLKARVSAGDPALGRELLESVEPSIYSTSIDFSTIETMSATRERISEKMARKRSRPGALDVKLARGGIRDIEFLAQCLQRLHGGRDTWVRMGGTLQALARLHEKDLLSTTEYSRLAHAYQFLRKLEHVLQFEDDRQTHTLPADPVELEIVARRMSPSVPAPKGISASAHLLKELNQHLENVQTIYERIVHAQRPLYYAPVTSFAVPETDYSFPPEHQAVLLKESLLRSLDENAPKLASRVRARSGLRENKLLAEFLDHLLARPDDLRALEQNIRLAEWTIDLFTLSPFLAEQFVRFPELLQAVEREVENPGWRYAFEGLAAPLNDIDGLRRFFRTQIFRIQVGSICLREPVFQTLDRTSALAEFVIARAYRIALEHALEHARSHATSDKQFIDPPNEMMVVALGRLGMREFDLASDADLVFIIPDAEMERQRFWTRVAERLIEILTSYTSEGTLLSLDTRLRPNGREGMLVQTESAFVDYFSSKAEAWEGMAYMKARGVAGDTDRATKFLTELQQVDWRRYGQGGRSKLDLRQMRMRLQREQESATPLKAAQGGYYDADFILMYLRLKGAGLFFKSLNTPERIDIVEKMGHLERADAEFLLESTTHFRALDHALRVVTGRAENKIPPGAEQRRMIAELMGRWTGQTTDPGALDSQLLAVQKRLHHLFERSFSS